MILDFFAGNAGTIIAVLALVAALQANAIARKSKAGSDRMLLSEKKRGLIQEIDRQHVSLIRLRFVMQGQQLQLQLCPEIEGLQPGETNRVEANLAALDELERLCLQARSTAELINVRHDPASIDAQFANVSRLTAHVQKDLEHEQILLEGKKNLAKTAPGRGAVQPSVPPDGPAAASRCQGRE